MYILCIYYVLMYIYYVYVIYINVYIYICILNKIMKGISIDTSLVVNRARETFKRLTRREEPKDDHK